MANDKTPARVNDTARPESGTPPDRERDSDLIEVVKRNAEFREWGPYWGPLLYWLSLKATRPRSLLWSGFIAVLGTMAGYVWRYGLPAIG